MIIRVINKLKYLFEFSHFKYNWRRRNSNNYTTVGNLFPYDKVTVGDKTYGTLNINTYGNEKEYLKIGSYCSIAGNVKFLLGGEHGYTNLSTYPFRKYINKVDEVTQTRGPIIINDDVWIGENTIILSGVEIGQGAVIGAGSIVTKDVPPYAIFIGNSVKKYRFSNLVIEKLINFRFSILEDDLIKKNINLLYENINESNVDTIIKRLNDDAGASNHE